MKDFLDELDNEISWNTNPSDKKEVTPKQNLTGENKKDISNNTKTKEDRKPASRNNNNNNNNSNNSFKWKFVSTFPDTKFYLPTLREGYTRFMPIWWNNETWSKNMWMIQYADDIVIIDCWIQFADDRMPWISYSVPDVSFLTKYKKNIKAVVLTHGHLDHIGTLKHVLPALWMPPLYWTKLTLWLAKKSLEEAWLLDKTIFIEIDAWSDKKISIWQFKFEFFRVNHSIPDCAWLYIESPGWAKFVHTWDFKIDHTPAIDEPADLERIQKIWNRWITLLFSDSTWSPKKWFSTSEKEVWEALDEIVKNHTKWRLIIAAFSSWISRVQQLVDSCNRCGKTIFLSWRSMIENINIAKELWYLKIPKWIVKKMTPKSTEGIPPHKQVIITTWSQWEQFSALVRMAEWKHNSIEIIKWDTVVFSSSVIPWNERSVVWIINKLIKLWANVLTKDDWEFHTWWHAFQEEQKLMLKLVNPKYFMPVYGDLYFRTIHKNTAVSGWFNSERVLLLDNWNIVDFAPSWVVFKSKIKAPIQEIIVDWHGMWILNPHVMQAREKMMNSWVLVIMYRVDKKTKAIMWHIKLETRWLVYLDEVRDIHRMIIKKSRSIYEDTVKDVPDMEEKDLLKIIRTDLESFLLKKIDRSPMIIPILVEV